MRHPTAFLRGLGGIQVPEQGAPTEVPDAHVEREAQERVVLPLCDWDVYQTGYPVMRCASVPVEALAALLVCGDHAQPHPRGAPDADGRDTHGVEVRLSTHPLMLDQGCTPR